MKDSKEATNVYRRDLQNHGKQTKQNDEKTKIFSVPIQRKLENNEIPDIHSLN